MKLYFAGPLFSQAERDFNEQVTTQLERLGYKVFLPQRDGVERGNAKFSNLDDDQFRQAIFSMDEQMIEECDVFLFVLDGRVPDEGACVELGIAHHDRKVNKKARKIVGLQTDRRAAFLKAKLNPMLRVPLDFVAESVEELLEHLAVTAQ